MQGIGTNKGIFAKLENAQHLVYEGELFAGAPVAEYWNLGELLPMFGLEGIETYKNESTLRGVFYEHTPPRIKSQKPEKMERLFSDNVHIIADKKDFDAEMSRYACWTLVKEIDGCSPMEFYQEYFLAPNSSFETIHFNARATSRIALRDFEKKYQKQLSGIVYKFHGNYSVLNREITQWFFGNLNAADIQYHYHLNESKPLADYMNDRLLDAYGRLLQSIVNKYDESDGVRTYNMLRNIAYRESVAARRNFMFGKPENNFETSSIADVERQLKKRESEFAQQYINSKVR